MAAPVTKYAKMILNPEDVRFELEKALVAIPGSAGLARYWIFLSTCRKLWSMRNSWTGFGTARGDELRPDGQLISRSPV